MNSRVLARGAAKGAEITPPSACPPPPRSPRLRVSQFRLRIGLPRLPTSSGSVHFSMHQRFHLPWLSRSRFAVNAPSSFMVIASALGHWPDY